MYLCLFFLPESPPGAGSREFKKICRMKRIALPAFLLSLVVCLAPPCVSGQPGPANRFRRSLAGVLSGIEERFDVRIDCRKFSPDTLALDFAEMRIRPWSVSETLDEVTRPLDLKWSHRGGNRYRIEPYEYYRRTPEQGRRILEWLSAEYDDRESWERRRAAVLREARERLDMQPLYDSLAADPQVFLGEVRRFDGYTTQGYALETLPGVFVCGTVYAPIRPGGRRPLIVSPAGHWPGGRLRPDQQYRMATFARMGAVAVDLDIVGWGDGARTVPFPHEDPRSMRLQALWSKAVTDWAVASRPEIDTTRMAATGGSGGATHVLLLALQDDRFRVLAPVVHLVAHFDGGCPCESAVPLSTVAGGSCIPELLAAVAAPNPLLAVSDSGDWTASWPESEYPYLQRIWGFYGTAERVRNVHLPDERHDYGANKRRAVYEFFARELELDLDRADESRVTVQEEGALRSFPEGAPVPAGRRVKYGKRR